MTVCPSKLLYHIPCPGCGLTRATLLLLKGEMVEAIRMNPNCIPAVAALVAYPFLAIAGILRRHSYVSDCYRMADRALANRFILGALVAFEAAVWIHNIVSGI